MSDLDVFRQDFSGILTGCAKARRASLRGGVGSSDDFKIIALFERLAREAETIDPTVFRQFHSSADQGLETRSFVFRREALLAQVGVLYWPTDAADLIGWIGVRCSEDLDLDREPCTAMLPTERPRSRGGPSPARKSRELARSWASDFSAGFGIVAPLLSLWNVRLAVEQLHDRAFIVEHASVPATVISVKPASISRSNGSASDVVMAFQQASGETCRVTWHSVLPPFAGAPGESMPVVPRSSVCELPLIPTQIGDPMQTFAIAAALMAGGLGSLKVWAWLFRHSLRPTSRPTRFPAGSRPHDLA